MSRGKLFTFVDGAKKEPIDWQGAEFPEGYFTTPPSAEALEVSRRGVLGIVSAALAVAGAQGCRRPVDKIVPYQKLPEELVLGVPMHYTSAYDRRGDGVGLLVECHEGRPTKVDGNPQHPSSQGAADLITQASIFELYDVDRSRNPRSDGKDATWADFDAFFQSLAAKHASDGGAKLHILSQPTSSPSIARVRRLVKERFGKVTFRNYSAAHTSNSREGARIAFGAAGTPIYQYGNAKVVVSLDCDFLQSEPGSVRASKDFARARRPGPQMSRLYVVEPGMSTTGSVADHRVRVPASQVGEYALALAAELGVSAVPKARVNADAATDKWIKSVAKDLQKWQGGALVVAGSRQPAWVHAVAFAINEKLGGFGRTMAFGPVADPDERHAEDDIAALAKDIADGKVETLLILGGNPVYDAPGSLKLGDLIGKVPTTVHLGHTLDETSLKTKWHLPRAHVFESWGDLLSLDGTASVQQPLIAPIFGGRSELEILMQLARAPETTALDFVKATARQRMLAARGLKDCVSTATGFGCKDMRDSEVAVTFADLDRDWIRVLGSGVLGRGELRPMLGGGIAHADIQKKIPARAPSPTKDSVEVVMGVCPKMLDGRYANNVWMQELPDPITKLVWDNAAIVSPKTAAELGLKQGDMIRLTKDGRSVVAAVYPFVGQADNTVGLSFGWGRTAAGRLGTKKGFDAFPLTAPEAFGFATGVTLAKEPGAYKLVSTQKYNSQDEDHSPFRRPLARESSLEDFKKRPNFAELQSPPPANMAPLWQRQDYSQSPQWGMVVDLNACTGCSACVVACHAENNVSAVGKIEADKGRQMSWLRIDRYFVTKEYDDERAAAGKIGVSDADPAVAYQPLGCQHCEEAPCENVCPVNATVHSPDGLNEMAYNRCVGTRYCAANCPYKVRRFNYLNWHNDGIWLADGKTPELLHLQRNPDVSVRFRGVMEKCSYCVQRIQKAKIGAKRENRPLRDGEVIAACQQTCPTDAISFGNLADKGSAVHRAAENSRKYALLAELGVRPRTTFLGKVRNPNPEIV